MENNYKLNPINLDNGVIQIHPLGGRELMKHAKVVNDLFEILSDDENTKYISEKRVTDKKTISDQLLGITIGYQEQLYYAHFLTLKKLDKIIGMINIITPKRVEDTYLIKNRWFIEYYLNKQLWGHGIMYGAIKAVIQNMEKQGIINLGALCIPENFVSIRLLEKCGFKKIKKFDAKQDYYELS
jgi:RimJ/RimL family protein N-acetyltransferase